VAFFRLQSLSSGRAALVVVQRGNHHSTGDQLLGKRVVTGRMLTHVAGMWTLLDWHACFEATSILGTGHMMWLGCGMPHATPTGPVSFHLVSQDCNQCKQQP
jgi:hypothetical protein